MSKPNMTPALTLLSLVWNNQKGKSWDDINHCMSRALQLVIGSHMSITVEDFKHISSHYRPAYWLGEHGWEYPYALAVSCDNTGFAIALEEYLGRKPFFGNKITPVDSRGYTHRTSECARERLTKWTQVHIDGQPGEVTSISNERIIITLRDCGEKYPRRVLKLTHEQVLAHWPAPKKKKKSKESDEQTDGRAS
jgi:hypothetical protein